ncbi:MAG: TetR/AcrR family transcriptional regulator [Bacteroidota bacterium]
MQSTKQKILTAAARLFRKQGYNGTYLSEIAKLVGIQPPSIYNHFASKQELLRDLLLQVAHLFTKGMEEIVTTQMNAEEKLKRLIALHVRLTVDQTDAVALIAGEWIHLEEPTKSVYLQSRSKYEAQFKEIIEQGKQQGTIKDIDTDIMLFSTLSTLNWLYSWYSKNRDFNVIELERQITLCLMSGMSK